MGVKKFMGNREFSINKSNYSNLLVLGTVLIGMVIIFSCGVGSVSAKQADTVYVNSSGGNDLSDGSSWLLAKKTIINAKDNVNSGGTLNLANGKYVGDGNTNITIDKDLNIKGQSKTGSILNGTGTNWIFEVYDGVHLSLTNLTLTNGSSDYFGGIYNSGSLTVTNCNFSNDHTTAVGSAGGAILNYGNLIINGSSFTGNTAASEAGAIFNSGKLYINNSIFTMNSAPNGGGAIFNENNGHYISITNSQFIKNTAAYGGVIYNGFGTVKVNNTLIVKSCSFLNNIATDDGGVITNYGVAIVKFNRFFGNTATQGNVIYNGKTMNALFNWWGVNTGPSNKDISNYGKMKKSLWLILYITAKPAIIGQGEYSTVTADLTHDNNGVLQNEGMIPNGIPVQFIAKLGTLTTASGFINNGTAQAKLHAGNVVGIGSVSAIVNNQKSTVNTKIIDKTPQITSTNPNSDQRSISRTAILNIKFSDKIKYSTNFNGLTVKNVKTGKTLTLARTITNNILSIKTSLKTANTWYRVTIPESAIKNINGYNLKSKYSYIFKTGA